MNGVMCFKTNNYIWFVKLNGTKKHKNFKKEHLITKTKKDDYILLWFKCAKERGSSLMKYISSKKNNKEGEVYVVRGRVKWFNNEKGYGFIDYTENEDIFVHYSAINQEGYKTLSEGQFVEFNLLETTKGYQALDVKVVKETSEIK